MGTLLREVANVALVAVEEDVSEQVVAGSRWWRTASVAVSTIVLAAGIVAVTTPAQADPAIPIAIGWGGNNDGQLGNGDTEDRLSATAVVPGMSPGTWSMVDSGYNSSCGMDLTNALYCWGSNESGELGDGTTADSTEPVAVSDGDNAAGTWKPLGLHIAAELACALGTDNAAYCWGLNDYGQLGDGTTDNANEPVAVQNGANAAGTYLTLGTGEYINCGVGTDNEAYCWGYGSGGGLGNDDYVDASAPVAVFDGDNIGGTWTAISAGMYHVCALGSDTRAYCWGDGGNGALGNGDTSTSATPVRVLDGANAGGGFRTISSGYQFSCGLGIDNKAYCWGLGDEGRLGSGNENDSVTPVRVLIPGDPALLSVKVGHDGSHACAQTVMLTVLCWGDNSYNKLGGGPTKTDPSYAFPIELDLGEFAGSPILGVYPGYKVTLAIVSFVPTVPGAPTEVTATAGDRSASVQWLAPANTGGSAITGYEVTSSPGGRTCATSGALSCTVSGLTNGQQYTFTVKAENGLGLSLASSASNSVTPEPDGPPPTLTLNKGTRERNGNTRDVITTTGRATGLSAGTKIVVFFRKGNRGAFTRGVKVEVGARGAFTVTRSVNRNVVLTLYVARAALESNRQTWKTIR